MSVYILPAVGGFIMGVGMLIVCKALFGPKGFPVCVGLVAIGFGLVIAGLL